MRRYGIARTELALGVVPHRVPVSIFSGKATNAVAEPSACPREFAPSLRFPGQRVDQVGVTARTVLRNVQRRALPQRRRGRSKASRSSSKLCIPSAAVDSRGRDMANAGFDRRGWLESHLEVVGGMPCRSRRLSRRRRGRLHQRSLPPPKKIEVSPRPASSRACGEVSSIASRQPSGRRPCDMALKSQ